MQVKYIHLPHQMVTFKIQTKCADIINALSLLYGKYIYSKSPIAESKIYLIEIVERENGYMVYYCDNDIFTENPLQATKDIIYENTQYSSSVIALHGAAVEYHRNAYIFIAPTTSGKTTLTSYLTQTGMGYITDDCVLIDRANLSIIPVVTPIHLREGGLNVLTSLNIDLPELEHIQNETINRYVYLPKNCILSPLPIAEIYFIFRNENENVMEEMTNITAVMQLMKSVMVPYQITDSYMNIFKQIAEKGCAKIQYKDLEYVHSLICKG